MAAMTVFASYRGRGWVIPSTLVSVTVYWLLMLVDPHNIKGRPVVSFQWSECELYMYKSNEGRNTEGFKEVPFKYFTKKSRLVILVKANAW